MIVRGASRGITSQPWIYGKPTIIDLKWAKQEQQSAVFTAVLDHTSETAKDSFCLKIENIPLNNFAIVETPYLPSRIKEGRADFNSVTRIGDEGLFIGIDVKTRGIRFDFTEMETENIFVDVVRNVLSGMKLLTFRAEISSIGDDLTFMMISNLDDLVSGQLKRLTSQALMETEKRIRARLNSISSGKIAELDRLFEGRKNDIVGPIDKNKKQVGDLKIGIEGKIREITDDIQRRKKSELEGKAKKLLEGLLKKK